MLDVASDIATGTVVILIALDAYIGLFLPILYNRRSIKKGVALGCTMHSIMKFNFKWVLGKALLFSFASIN